MWILGSACDFCKKLIWDFARAYIKSVNRFRDYYCFNSICSYERGTLNIFKALYLFGYCFYNFQSISCVSPTFIHKYVIFWCYCKWNSYSFKKSYRGGIKRRKEEMREREKER